MERKKKRRKEKQMDFFLNESGQGRSSIRNVIKNDRICKEKNDR